MEFLFDLGVLLTFWQGEGVTGGVDEVLNYIRMNPGVKTSEVAVALDIRRRTLERWPKRLKGEKKVSYKGAHKIGGYFATEGYQ
jgi:ATP-dependent DNA helicase RecG